MIVRDYKMILYCNRCEERTVLSRGDTMEIKCGHDWYDTQGFTKEEFEEYEYFDLDKNWRDESCGNYVAYLLECGDISIIVSRENPAKAGKYDFTIVSKGVRSNSDPFGKNPELFKNKIKDLDLDRVKYHVSIKSIFPNRVRENGYYWVLRKDIHVWILASYEFGWWKLFGIDHNYVDTDFKEIDEEMVSYKKYTTMEVAIIGEWDLVPPHTVDGKFTFKCKNGQTLYSEEYLKEQNQKSYWIGVSRGDLKEGKQLPDDVLSLLDELDGYTDPYDANYIGASMSKKIEDLIQKYNTL